MASKELQKLSGRSLDKPKHPGGRPTKYKPDYCDHIVEYFKQFDPPGFPTFEGYATALNVHTDTLVEWAKIYPEFSASYKKAKQIQKDCLIRGGIAGVYSQPFAIFTAKNCIGWRDKIDIESDNKNTNLNSQPLTAEEIKSLSEQLEEEC